MKHLIDQAIGLYDGVTRRNREPYANQLIRMADLAQELNWLEPQIHLLIILHDSLEVVEGMNRDHLQQTFSLTPDEGVIIDLLTALENESSEDHFNRVLDSKNVLALQIKYLDCMDNTLIDIRDYDWYPRILGKSTTPKMDKYLRRADKITTYLTSIGF